MQKQLFKDMISVIRAEKRRREESVNHADPDLAYDQWLFEDLPFINELCLMILVALRHQFERETLSLAARANHGGKEISRQEWGQERQSLRNRNNQGRFVGLKTNEIKNRLRQKNWPPYILLLNKLTNLYKHDPLKIPDEEIIIDLHLDPEIVCGPLDESEAIRTGLANFLSLPEDADYCDIADQFVEITCEFISTVEGLEMISTIKHEKVSLNPKNFAH